MSRQNTLELPDDILQRAERLAVLSHRPVEEVLTDAVALSLPPVEEVGQPQRPVGELPDAEVLRLTELQLPAAEDRRLSELLDLQQSGELDAEERGELASLMQCYEVSLLRKSEALAEAVRRRLRRTLR